MVLAISILKEKADFLKVRLNKINNHPNWTNEEKNRLEELLKIDIEELEKAEKVLLSHKRLN